MFKAIVLFSGLILTAESAAMTPATPAEVRALDPFMAATLGAVPFVSGLYLSDRPARGILFTAVDLVLVLWMYTARNTASGDPANVKAYFLAMGANNLLDALLSARYAAHPHAPRLRLSPTEGEGLTAGLHWNF